MLSAAFFLGVLLLRRAVSCFKFCTALSCGKITSPQRLIICKPTDSFNKWHWSNQLLQERSNICGILNFTHTHKIQSYLHQNKNIYLFYWKLPHACQLHRGNIWLPDHYIRFWNTIWTTSPFIQDINRAIRTSSSTITVVVLWIIHPWLLVEGLITARELFFSRKLNCS